MKMPGQLSLNSCGSE